MVLEMAFIGKNCRLSTGDLWTQNLEWFLNEHQPMDTFGSLSDDAVFEFAIGREVRVPADMGYYLHNSVEGKWTGFVPLDLLYRVSVCDVGTLTGSPRLAHLLEDEPGET